MKPFSVKLKDTEARQKLLSGDPQTSGMRSGQVILKPGEEIGQHTTGNREEAIVILKGKAEVSSDKGESLIAEGDTVVYMPPDTKHNVKNIGKDNLRYIYIVK